MSIQQNAKFNSEQYATILNFLEDPQNYTKIFGVRGKTEVGVPLPRKILAWKELAVLINNKVDHRSVADRWRTYLNKYKAARERSSGTGFGVTEEDKKRGIHTVQAKLDMMCPHYERIHALVGKRPNIQPAATFDRGCITPETDLNKLLRFSADDVNVIFDVEPTIACVDSSTPHYVTVADATEDGPAVDEHAACNELAIQVLADQEKQATLEANPQDNKVLPNEFEECPMAASGSKRPVVLENNTDDVKGKKDRRKEMPSLAGTNNSTPAHNHLARTIHDAASAKAVALVTIEEKKLKFEHMKWETEREEREVRRLEEKEERLRLDEIERVRHVEEKAEKCRERRFALLQSLIKDEKSLEEINLLLSMLL